MLLPACVVSLSVQCDVDVRWLATLNVIGELIAQIS